MKKKLILNYVGRNDFDSKMYKDNNETYFIKDDYDDIIYIGKDIDNDPYGSIRNIEKYKNVEIVTVGDENLPTETERFNYMMLSRLEQDCKYFLGNGGRHKKYLQNSSIKDHIAEMKKIYNNFNEDKKPEWITPDKIEKYEKEMLQ